MVGYWVAHGALGYWDEVIFGGVVVVFLGFMALSWINTRNATLDSDHSAARQPDDAHAGSTSVPEEAPDRFRLD